jgi:AcrR family transcriptional regulator
MPRRIDPQARRAEIADAAMRVIARSGVAALTLRSLAEEMNGSITLVTHFVSNRASLFETIVDELVSGYDAEIADLERGMEGEARLRRFLEWLLPLSPHDVERESARIALNAARGEPSVDHFFEVMDARIRELLADHLRPLIAEAEIADAVDFVRAVMNGVTLSAVEHPELWTPRRQLAVLDRTLRTLALESAPA